MAGGNFVQRVISYVVNEVLVDGLANRNNILKAHAPELQFSFYDNRVSLVPRTFQKFAVRTSKSLEDISKTAAKKRQQIAEQVKEMSRDFQSRD
uniref:uncharacterized protein LOC122607854 isoform X1 n=1 Tax=Erigeron canadensis TaxID=72917 RepID=UPI001CB982D4|nr:uncharacterized protein LOC122607854 isoform X1 [Erigeron canadensis]